MTEELKKEIFEYLDALRDLSDVNMYGAAPWIVAKLGIDKSTARKVLQEWITNSTNTEKQT